MSPNVRIAALVASFFVLAPSLSAQGKGGVLGGFNFSELVAAPQDFAQRIGRNGGINMSGELYGALRLVLEAYWSEKGADGSTLAPSDTVAGEAVFNYVEVPLQFRLGFGRQARVFANGGVAGALRLKCNVKLHYNSGIVPTEACNGATGRELIKSADYSYVFGGGIAFRALLFEPSFEVRVIDGFVPIGGAGGPSALQGRNRVISTLIRLNSPCDDTRQGYLGC